VRVLVVDDQPDVVELLCMLLARLGLECRSAASGYDTLRVAHEFTPNVIFLDLGLPDVSGYDVARMLRARGSSAYIVAVSGWGREQDVQHALDAGFDRAHQQAGPPCAAGFGSGRGSQLPAHLSHFPRRVVCNPASHGSGRGCDRRTDSPP